MSEFTPVFTSRKFRDHAVVTYECICGCKPMAHVYQGVAEAGHEHCCCGRVHFAGVDPMQHMTAYLDQRRAAGEDEGVTYSFGNAEVQAPWGEVLTVAYALPQEGETESESEHDHEHEHHEHSH